MHPHSTPFIPYLCTYLPQAYINCKYHFRMICYFRVLWNLDSTTCVRQSPILRPCVAVIRNSGIWNLGLILLKYFFIILNGSYSLLTPVLFSSARRIPCPTIQIELVNDTIITVLQLSNSDFNFKRNDQHLMTTTTVYDTHHFDL